MLNDSVLSDRRGSTSWRSSLSALTDRDRELISTLPASVDFIAVSFCPTPPTWKKRAGTHGKDAALVSRWNAPRRSNLAEVIDASDVVMVARGDLGVEIGDAELPGLQKIIRESLARNKVVITATQMLQSMVDSRSRPAPKCWTWPTR